MNLEPDLGYDAMPKLSDADTTAVKEAIQGYLASISFADAMVGELVNALDASGRADRTIIVLWSDHGFHLGEKDTWGKFTLWERSSHVPFIIVAPGVTQTEPARTRRFPCKTSMRRWQISPGLRARARRWNQSASTP